MSRTDFLPLSVALLALTLAAYLPLGKNGFVDFDDEHYITRNPHVLAGMSRSSFAWAWTNADANYWLPVTWLSLQLDAQAFSKRGPDGHWQVSPAAVHWHNLFWHAGSVVLLFHLLRRLTDSPWPSFLVAALFAVHPMHVESVAWAVERKDVLSVFFGLLTLLAYLRYLEKPHTLRYLALVAAYALSLLSKPMLMTLPFVLLLLDYWPLGRLWSSPPAGQARFPVALGRLLFEKLPLFALAGSVGGITAVLRQRTGSALSLEVIPLSARLGNALVSYGQYLRGTFYPVDLAVLYPHPEKSWSAAAAGMGVALLLAITLLALWQGRRRPWLLVGWLWFAGTLVPVIGLTQGGDQAWADRFSYWPHIGLFVALVWALAELAGRVRIPAWACAAAALLGLGGLAILTQAQVKTWQSTATLWERALAVTADNHRAHACLGKYYQEQGRLDAAVLHMTQAVQLRPQASEYHYSLGVPLLFLGRLDEAAAEFQTTVELAPRHADAWYNLGVTCLRQERPGAAASSFRKVLHQQPGSADALAGMAQARLQEGKPVEAVPLFQTALERNPGTADAWHGLGRIYLAQGQLQKARHALERALEINPQLIAAHSELGLVLGRQGDWLEAVGCQDRAFWMQMRREQALVRMQGHPVLLDGLPPLLLIRCRLAFALEHCGPPDLAQKLYRDMREEAPDGPEKLTAKAWTLLLSPSHDPELAYEMVSQAIQAVAAPSPRMLAVLSLAQVRRGQYRQALQAAQQALDRALRTGPV